MEVLVFRTGRTKQRVIGKVPRILVQIYLNRSPATVFTIEDAQSRTLVVLPKLDFHIGPGRQMAEQARIGECTAA